MGLLRVYYIPGIMRLEHACWNGSQDAWLGKPVPAKAVLPRLSWADKACGSAQTPEEQSHLTVLTRAANRGSGLDDLSGLCFLAYADKLQDQGGILLGLSGEGGLHQLQSAKPCTAHLKALKHQSGDGSPRLVSQGMATARSTAEPLELMSSKACTSTTG